VFRTSGEREVEMDNGQRGPEQLATVVKVALESGDLETFRELLDPNVRWGAPDDPAPSCQNRDQVLAWYRRGRAAGVSASVFEVVVGQDALLIGLSVVGNAGAQEAGGSVERWQVLTVRDGRVVDIRGFEDRQGAAVRAGVPA
jgi:ketosteroid isomerase-like protein